MNLEQLKSSLPEYARDTKVNLGAVLGESEYLSAKQILGIALSCAYATRQKSVVAAILNEAQNILSSEELAAAKSAAAIMAMNNIYYRFAHLVTDKEYSKMPAGLRMQAIIRHGIDKIDFELYSLGVSILNGCGMCIDAHEREIIKSGLTKNSVQLVAKIAAVINATAQVMEIES